MKENLIKAMCDNHVKQNMYLILMNPIGLKTVSDFLPLVRSFGLYPLIAQAITEHEGTLRRFEWCRDFFNNGWRVK